MCTRLRQAVLTAGPVIEAAKAKATELAQAAKDTGEVPSCKRMVMMLATFFLAPGNDAGSGNQGFAGCLCQAN